MVFWLVIALLTFAACVAVLLPVLRAGAAAGDDVLHDIEVYRDQLQEVERDVERGVMDASQADQARAEIGRRILRLSAQAQGAAVAAPAARGRQAAIALTAVVLAVPVLSWGMYGLTGSPSLPGQPLQARLDKSPADSSLDEMVARAEGHLGANPQDGRGWDVLAPIYMRMHRYDQAVTAYRNAIRLMGSTAARETGLGEAIASAAGGIVTAEAQAAFERALVLDPQAMRARFMLGAGHAQEGDHDRAATVWNAMLRQLPAGSPWHQAVAQALASLDTDAQDAPQAGSGPGPTPQEIEAAAEMSPDERTAMVESMVAGLDRRLSDNPQDHAAWQRLVRSYMVLGRPDDARDALERALAALGEDSAAGARLAEFGISLGL